MKQRGFTVIEVLIVVAIAGILLAVIIPNVQAFMRSGNQPAVSEQSIDRTITGTVVTIDRAADTSLLYFSDGELYVLVTNESLDRFDRLIGTLWEYQLHSVDGTYEILGVK